ncbi:MAG TPA: permease-like cell division protein FtsX [Candidatus Pacearchaeota archaeon]|nr:permease-like cell division protein FtsX [Candidatus Pacearchaeota archaeon]HOK94121.1 permease-like cell division protein FtsX [Candidatus Pacearchaeota archaeon]HPO75249.1 permease-like cell division protein FtsX [Candidatus Pacearchaeota archaeon]
MFTNFFRVFKFGWQEVSRNIGVSLGTIFIIFVAVFLVGGTLLLRGMTENLISTLQSKVDISVYFKLDVKEEDALLVKERIENFPEVEKVEYVSKEDALKSFKERYQDNSLVIESLNEIGDNPLPSSLNIQATEASSYENLANFLEKGEFKDLIDKVNYRQNKTIIERLFSISNNIKEGGFIISIILVIIAVLVTFNTIRLAIYSKREEIETMKLLGATNWFVRGPFLIQGLITGLLAGLISFLLFFVIDHSISPGSFGIFGELGILSFFEENILLFLLIEIGGGVIISMFATLLATQKYLKV